MRPVIGLTTYKEQARTGVWDTEFALLPGVYVSAVAGSGATAVLLPPQPDGAEDVVARLDALVVTGGADVDPALYGGQPVDPATIRPDRDRWETAVLRAALASDLPVLAICRGAQLLNVALGGTLVQHVPDRVGHSDHQPGAGRFGRTKVELSAGTRLAELIGDHIDVACYHHQAVDDLAPGLVVSARAPDGTIEAVERQGPGFCLGVQWHPEEDAAADDRLFRALVAAARDFAAERAGRGPRGY